MILSYEKQVLLMLYLLKIFELTRKANIIFDEQLLTHIFSLIFILFLISIALRWHLSWKTCAIMKCRIIQSIQPMTNILLFSVRYKMWSMHSRWALWKLIHLFESQFWIFRFTSQLSRLTSNMQKWLIKILKWQKSVTEWSLF